MINHPIVVTDYSSKIENPRLMHLSEKNKTNRGFVYSSFVTDKERVRRYLTSREQQKKLEERIATQSPTRTQSNLDDKIRSNILQPYMRFRPRTDLERIIDVLNDRNKLRGNISKNILYNQLKKIELGFAKDVKSASVDGKSPDKRFSTFINQRSPRKNLGQSPGKRSPPVELRRVHADNSAAKNILKDLYYHTHFKGAASLTNQKPDKDAVYDSTTSQKLKKSRMKSTVQKRDPIKHKEKEDVFLQITQSEFNKESEPVYSNFSLNYNPIIQSEERKVDYKALRQIKKMLNKGDEATGGQIIEDIRENRDDSPQANYKKLIKKIKKSVKINDKKYDQADEVKKEEEKVVIDSEAINKNELNTIALKVLKKCNYFHKKSPNNSNSLKSGRGKTMITNGMSIVDFETKYRLKPEKESVKMFFIK